jgi:hypothetical protein
MIQLIISIHNPPETYQIIVTFSDHSTVSTRCRLYGTLVSPGYLTMGTNLEHLDTSTGKELWRQPLPSISESNEALFWATVPHSCVSDKLGTGQHFLTRLVICNITLDR